MNKKLPNFLLLGPPKTATTSLHYYLSQHPQIFMSETKETRYFDYGYKEDLAGYDQYFINAADQIILGEATPTYAFLPFAADRIKKHFPGMKLILCFRNPVDRAFSGWSMRKARGAEKNSFREALELNIEQRKTVDFFGEAGARRWMDDHIANNKKNEILYRTYIDGSMYNEQLKYYRSLFADDQIKIIFTEDLKKNAQDTLKEIYCFLKADTSFTHTDTEEKNTFKKVRLKPLFNLFGKKKVKDVKKIIPAWMHKILKPIMRQPDVKPEITEEDRIFATRIFKESIAELELLTGRDLSAWKTTYKNSLNK